MTSFDGECGETEVCSFGEENREDVHRCWGYQCARRHQDSSSTTQAPPTSYASTLANKLPIWADLGSSPSRPKSRTAVITGLFIWPRRGLEPRTASLRVRWEVMAMASAKPDRFPSLQPDGAFQRLIRRSH